MDYIPRAHFTLENRDALNKYLFEDCPLDIDIMAVGPAVIQRNIADIISTAPVTSLADMQRLTLMTHRMKELGWLTDQQEFCLKMEFDRTPYHEFDTSDGKVYTHTIVKGCFVKLCRKEKPLWVQIMKSADMASGDSELRGVISHEASDTGRFITFEKKHVHEIDLML